MTRPEQQNMCPDVLTRPEPLVRSISCITFLSVSSNIPRRPAQEAGHAGQVWDLKQYPLD
jgi:hypothetical protein